MQVRVLRHARRLVNVGDRDRNITQGEPIDMPRQSSKTPTSAQTRIVGKPGHQSVKVGDFTFPIREEKNEVGSVTVSGLSDSYTTIERFKTYPVISDPATAGPETTTVKPAEQK